MTKEELDRAVEQARRAIAAMPEWKQRILPACLDGKSTNDVPRTPIVPNDDGGF